MEVSVYEHSEDKYMHEQLSNRIIVCMYSRVRWKAKIMYVLLEYLFAL